jgi:hypothetical protein
LQVLAVALNARESELHRRLGNRFEPSRFGLANASCPEVFTFASRFGIDDSATEVRRALDATVAHVRERGLDERAFTAAKARVILAYATGLESQLTRATSLGAGFGSLEEQRASVEALTKDQMNAIVRQDLATDRRALVHVVYHGAAGARGWIE